MSPLWWCQRKIRPLFPLRGALFGYLEMRPYFRRRQAPVIAQDHQQVFLLWGQNHLFRAVGLEPLNTQLHLLQSLPQTLC